ncbi:MAG: hypothetical protein V4577_21460 [Bacteroidota bacterium]
MKKLYLIFAMLIAAGASAQIKIPTNPIKVKFSWLRDTVNHRSEPYSAMLIPVKLEGCPKVFYMQFDLGAPHSMFYTRQTKTILAKYPKTDTSAFIIAKGHDEHPEIIGTLGEDLIDGRTLVIDYPRRVLTVTDSLPATAPSAQMSSFMLMKGSILLPALLHNKQAILFFDTGSSAFELLTSKSTSDQLAVPNAATESYSVNSWGRMLTANTRPTGDSLTMASLKIPIKKVTYIEGASDSQVQQMLKLGIGGMIGNKLFISAVLVLDTRHKKMALIAR